MTRKIRIAAWVVIVAIAAFQAYAQRYALSPDGVSYLDLSDAVVAGHWGGLVNLYWSPLYPALIGVLRAIFGAGPALDAPMTHLANVAAFVAAFGAFEYFVIPVLEIASAVRGAALRGPGGLAAAYVAFGLFALIMTPLALTTPDLLAATAVLVALGAMLRLHRGGALGASHDWRTAVVAGLALGGGALAKSFLVPWAIVCFAALALATWRRGWTPTGVAVVAWAVIALPWCAVLSRHAGRFTFGETGRLTYVWYVNDVESPSAGGVPPGARTANSDAILPGVGIVGDAPGTDPMWLEPTRWNAMLRPHWSMKDEWGTLVVFQIFYVEQFAPLLFLITLLCVAPPGSRRRAWRLGWVVLVPAFVGLGAYALVIVTARYIMPFTLAIVLMLLATLPVPRRIRPNLAVIGLLIPLALEAANKHTLVGLGLVAAAIGALLAGVLVRTTNRIIWALSIVLAALATHILLVPLGSQGAALGCGALCLAYWLLARRAISTGRSIAFARQSESAIGVIVALMFVVRFQNRASDDLLALNRSRLPNWGNVALHIATNLEAHGVGPGTRIAVIGPHDNAYWARAGRLHIAADVPRPLVKRFWNLPRAEQDSLLAQFARAGAAYAIASEPPPGGKPADPRWQQFRFDGWLRRLTP